MAPVRVRLEGSPPAPVEAWERRLRDDAVGILEAALAAVEPARLVESALRWAVNEGGSSPATVLAVGKAARPMARGAVSALGPARIRAGLVLEPDVPPSGEPSANEDPSLPGFQLRRGGHPLPTEEGRQAAREAVALALESDQDTPVLLLLSGGGSALLTAPAQGISLADLRSTTHLLLRAGASIHELNTVRKHLEELKGGGLARALASRPLTVLTLSDVVGDSPGVIASGPAAPDPSTFQEAVDVLRGKGVWDAVPAGVRARLAEGTAGRVPETPAPGDPIFRQVDFRVVGSVATAVEGAAAEARARGYAVRRVGCAVEGEARTVGRRLAEIGRRMAPRAERRGRPMALVAGGETTVTVMGDGLGGPNQEVALAAALALRNEGGGLVASLGTDGVDGPTDAAGGVAAGGSASRAEVAGRDPWWGLERNDARAAMEAAGDLLVTGPTGTNVMDVHLVLRLPASEPALGKRPTRPTGLDESTGSG